MKISEKLRNTAICYQFDVWLKNLVLEKEKNIFFYCLKDTQDYKSKEVG